MGGSAGGGAPGLRALSISMILKVIVKGGRRRQPLCLGFAGAVLDAGHHLVGLEQEGGVGHVSFLLGGLRGNGRGVSVWGIHSVGGGQKKGTL